MKSEGQRIRGNGIAAAKPMDIPAPAGGGRAAVTDGMSRRGALLAAAPWWRLAAAPAVEQVDLFRRGDHRVHTYRIPALLETRKGTLLAVVDARHDSDRDLPARISMVIRRSADGGRSWSPPRTLHAVPEGGAGDPSLLLDPSGRIWCFFAYGPPGIGFRTAKPGELTGPAVLQFHAISSDDDGLTWSPAIDLTPQVRDPAWHALFATSGTHFVTSRGRFLVPLVVLDARQQVSARNAYSDDGGKTWKAGPAIAPDSDESKAVEVAGGEILQNMRYRSTRLVARSTDGGITFPNPAPDASLNDAVCNAGLARYRHGGRDLLLFTNAAGTRRENLAIRFSADSGRTWSPAKSIHPGPAAYSTVIPLAGGDVGVLYECGDSLPTERITFARLPIDWLPRP